MVKVIKGTGDGEMEKKNRKFFCWNPQGKRIVGLLKITQRRGIV